jgi:hypothetical protein
LYHWRACANILKRNAAARLQLCASQQNHAGTTAFIQQHAAYTRTPLPLAHKACAPRMMTTFVDHFYTPRS